MSRYTKGIGERIRYIRRRVHMGQGEFGEKFGVTRQSISGYENERLIPSRNVIEKVCELYDVNPAWLHFGVGPHSQKPGATSEILLPGTGEELTSFQLMLIEFVLSDKAGAQMLAELLFHQGLMGEEE